MDRSVIEALAENNDDIEINIAGDERGQLEQPHNTESNTWAFNPQLADNMEATIQAVDAYAAISFTVPVFEPARSAHCLQQERREVSGP